MAGTSPKSFVFVLIPFSQEFHDVYQLGIKEACASAGMYCERVDEQVFDGTILDRIYNQIRTADVIVADMSGRNPNVFYEVGYAHALNKRVVLLTNKADDIPFDLKNYPHIVYSSVTELRDDLSKRLRWVVENLDQTQDYFDFPLRLYVSGQRLSDADKYVLPRDAKGEPAKIIEYDLDVFNSPDQVLSTTAFRFALVVPEYVGSVRIKPYKFARESYPSQLFKQSDGLVVDLVQQ